MDDTRFDFENLKGYQPAVEYIDLVYDISRLFPKNETFALADQWKRAAISICLNIAEGSGGSKAEFGRFPKISRRSVRECIAITEICIRQKFITNELRKKSRSYCLELSKMLTALIKSLKE